MVSRFNQLMMSATVVTPLLLSVAIVVIALYPSEYASCWSGLFSKMQMPNFKWWMVNIFVLLFVVTFFNTGCILRAQSRCKKNIKSIALTSLKLKTINVVQLLAMLAPWTTLLFKGNDSPIGAILVITGVVALVICIVQSSYGYSSLVFALLRYNCYEGINKNNTPVILLSKRHWRNAADVRRIVPLTDEMALIV